MLTMYQSGREDREGPWSLAVAGFPGSGKTMLASTAPKPLFVFFQEKPRLKSVADRGIAYMKLYNEVNADGNLTVPVQDKMQALLAFLSLTDHDFETVVIDTGDELFQEMKLARKLRNRGEFGPGDWGWLADTYRELINAFIDLDDIHVIVTFHLKHVELGDDLTLELMLQGAAADEAAGWFDIIGALDTHEVVGDDGTTVTRRALLTHSSRMHPWVKDHSGMLPRHFDISDEFAGDVPRLLELVNSAVPEVRAGVIAEIEPAPDAEATERQEVPTPEDLQAKKKEEALGLVEPDKDRGAEPKEASEAGVTPSPQTDETGINESAEQAAPDDGGQDEAPDEPEAKAPIEAEPSGEGQDAEPEPEADESSTESETTDDPVALVEEMLDGEEVEADSGEVADPDPSPPAEPEPEPEAAESEDEPKAEPETEPSKPEPEATERTCNECGEVVEDVDLLDLTQIRFREDLCREHFKIKVDEAKARR